MNKILIEVSAGELFDKISILEIKKVKIKDKAKLIDIERELNSLREALKKNKLDQIDGFLKECVEELTNINLDLWEIEDLKRKYEKDKDFGERFIKVSRDVHFKNDRRAEVKRQINIHTGSAISEVKEYTSY
tara:strand:+ start:691 stop:1086 length:396 start_codon:yes stop_codon:yes gene_type:complete